MSKAIEGAALLGGAIAVGAAEFLMASSGVGTAALPWMTKLMLTMAMQGVAMEAGAIASALTSNRGMNITTRQSASARQIIYGMQRVGGVIIYKSTTGSHKDQLNYVIVIAGHVCDSLVNLYLDGRQVHWAGGNGNITRGGFNFGGAADGNSHTGPNGVQYNFSGAVYAEARFGDQTEGEDTTTQIMGSLRANDPNWDFDASGNDPWVAGCTYIYLKVENNPSLFPGEPEVRITVNGKSDIWDPRTQTSGYTANWALVAADMISNTQFGLGDNTVNQLNLIAAANVCDEQVDLASGQTESRYAVHYHYDTSTAPGDALAAIMSAAAGSYSRIGGEHYVWPAYWQGPSFTFGPQHLTAPFSWKPYRSVPDLINCVNGTYTAPTFPYNVLGNLYDKNGFYNGEAQDNFSFAFQPTNAPQYAQDTLHGFPNNEWLTADGGVTHPYELTLSTVLSVAQWQRVAKIYLLRNRFQGMGTLEMNLAAYVMQPKNTFDFNFPYLGWQNKILEVSGASLSVDEDQNSGAQSIRASFTVNETDSSVYEWSTSEELNVYDVPVLPSQTPLTPAPPTNMVLTSGPDTAIVQPDGSLESVIQVTFDTPLDNLAVQIQVQYALASTGNWNSAPPIDISLNVGLISGVIAGQAYDVRIRTARATGVASDWLEQDGYVVSTTPSFLGTLGAQIPVITANSQLGGTVPGEMLTNGNFANGLAGWIVLDGSPAIDTTQHHLGTQSLITQGASLKQVINLTGGHTYLYQAWVMTDGNVVVGGAQGAGVYIADPSSLLTIQKVNGTLVNLSNQDPGSLLAATAATPWTLVQLTIAVAPTGGGSYSIVITDHYGVSPVTTAHTWFDGCSLTDTTGAADVTGSQAIVYTGASESIVPNGNFILGDMQGWGNSGFVYGSDGFGPRIYSSNGAAISPSFAVVPGQKYRLNYNVYGNPGVGGIYLRIAYEATYFPFITPNVNYLDLLADASRPSATAPTIFAYDWTCPAGMFYASMAIYAGALGGTSDLACKYVSCIPYAATGQWGADVTGSNTSNDTNNVSGVPASTIAEVVPTGFKLFINNGDRSYSIQAI
jgi:hypothetical protein